MLDEFAADLQGSIEISRLNQAVDLKHQVHAAWTGGNEFSQDLTKQRQTLFTLFLADVNHLDQEKYPSRGSRCMLLTHDIFLAQQRSCIVHSQFAPTATILDHSAIDQNLFVRL